jgi:hypothetical protein
MSTSNATPLKFRPERPIYLHEVNTGFRTRDQVIFAIEQLRDLGWLCVYGEKTRPFHLCFNNPKELQEFKKTCSNLKITLKSPVIKPEELEELEQSEHLGETVPGAESTDMVERPDGRIIE